MPKRSIPSFSLSPNPGQLLFTPPRGTTITLDASNAVSVLYQLKPFLYPQAATHVSTKDPFEFDISQHFKTNQGPRAQQQQPIGFTSRLRLTPISESLAEGQNVFQSALMPSKQKAKQDVALQACHALRALNLPLRLYSDQTQSQQPSSSSPILNQTSTKQNKEMFEKLKPTKEAQDPPRVKPPDQQQQPLIEVEELPEIVELDCHYPFGRLQQSREDEEGGSPYFHHILIKKEDGRDLEWIGLTCRNELPNIGDVEDVINGQKISFQTEDVLQLRDTLRVGDVLEDRLQQLDALTRLALQGSVNRKRFKGELPFYLSPVEPEGGSQWELVKDPLIPITDISDLSSNPDQLLIARIEALKFRLFKFSHISTKLNLTSSFSDLPSGSTGLQRFFKHLPRFASIGHFYSVITLLSSTLTAMSSLVHLNPVLKRDNDAVEVIRASEDDGEAYQALLPHSVLEISQLDLCFWQAVAYTPFFIRSLHDRVQASVACEKLGLSKDAIPFVVEALTPPGRGISRNYETLETVGDSFLKLATSVHLYLEYPSFEEGKLSDVRSQATDNAFLRRKLFDSGFARYILYQSFFVTDNYAPIYPDDGEWSEDNKSFRRKIPRKILSDVTEALLGAAYVSGGIDAALKVGNRIGLYVGTESSWTDHQVPSHEPINVPASPQALQALQATIGYQFQDLSLLVRALTHRSASSGPMTCYQRDEWLGDALLDFWAINTLYNSFKPITPSQLTLMRASLVSNSSLGFLALRKLKIDELMIYKVDNLDIQIRHAKEEYMKFNTIQSFFSDLSNTFGSGSPPKILSDILESIIGVCFIDCGFEIETVFKMIDSIYKEVIEAEGTLNKCELRDPISELNLVKASSGCKKIITVSKSESLEATGSKKNQHQCSITHHGITIGESMNSVSRSLAQQRASSIAIKKLTEILQAPIEQSSSDNSNRNQLNRQGCEKCKTDKEQMKIDKNQNEEKETLETDNMDENEKKNLEEIKTNKQIQEEIEQDQKDEEVEMIDEKDEKQEEERKNVGNRLEIVIDKVELINKNNNNQVEDESVRDSKKQKIA